jgi:hypothetical protein
MAHVNAHPASKPQSAPDTAIVLNQDAVQCMAIANANANACMP